MARSDWARVPLGQVLTQVFDEVKVKDGVTYNQVTVRMHNKGLTLRQEVGGEEIKTKRQFRVREGQFVFSRIDARNGAMGLVPRDLDGAIVSNDFPVFDIRTDLVDSTFFKYFVSTAPFLDACLAQSKGTSNRRRLKEPDFLEIPITLPSLAEQHRIVARIDALAARIAKAQALQTEAVEEAEGLIPSTYNTVFSAIEEKYWEPLGKRAQLLNGRAFKPKDWSESGIPIVRIQNLNNENAPFNYCNFEVAERFHIDNDELLVSWSGTPGTSFGAHIWRRGHAILNQHIFKVLLDEQGLTKPFFRYAMNHKLDEMISKAHGAVGLRHITKGELEGINIPVPSLEEQHRIVAHLDRVQARVDALKQLQEKSQEELDALLPSVLDKVFRGEL